MARRSLGREESLSSRCFWHLHTAHGRRCVLRIGSCEQPPLATPAEAEAALAAAPRPPPARPLDLSKPVDPAAVEARCRDTSETLLRHLRDTSETRL